MWCIPFWVTLTLTLTSDLISRFFVPLLQITFLNLFYARPILLGGIRHITVTLIIFSCLKISCFLIYSFRNTITVSNVLDPDQDQLVVLIRVQTVCKGNQ